MMILRIEQETSVKEVQKQFSTWYPFLQLHFYKPGSSDNKFPKKAQWALPEWPLSKLKTFSDPECLSISAQTTVAELLKNFSDIGLQAQVCRKSGNHWVETFLTSDWTLARQNEEAMQINMSDADLHLHKSKTN